MKIFTRFSGIRLPKSADLFESLFSDNGSELVRRQTEETRTALPTLAFLQFCATFAVGKFLEGTVATSLLFGWMLCSLGAAVFLAVLYFRLEKAKKNLPKAQGILKFAPSYAGAMGLVWALVPLVLASPINVHTNLIIYPFVLIVAIVGLLSLIRFPIAAILFSAFVFNASTYSLSNYLATSRLDYTLFSLVSVTALIAVVLVFNRNFAKQCALDEARTRDTEVIKLLLNEFEAGVGDWLWETNATGRLVYVSPRLSQILNIPAEVLFAESLTKVLRLDTICDLDAKLKLPEPILAFEAQTMTETKTWHWEISAKPLFGAAGFTGHRGVGRDVTLHKQQTLQIEHAKEEAEKANTAKSQFLAVISHELRTPINAIVGFSEVLSAWQGESLPMAARREYLGTILESAKHLQGLINDVLDATRMERGAIHLDEQFNDAAELIEVAVKILRDQALSSNVSLVAHVMDDVQVMSDLTRIKQVIINLITNAIKFSPEGGIVNIDMVRSTKGELIISVRDAGIGISKEDAERVFEPFVQVENGLTRRFGGIGLGLAIARKIARIHGGDLTLEGEVGVGTDARFLLPASRLSWPKAKKPALQQVVAA